MFRAGLIALVATLMVADPYLCAVPEACADCPSSEQSGDSHEHQPSESSEDACHSCLCQGATASTNRHDLVAASMLLVAPQPQPSPTVFVADYCSHARHVHLGQPTTGRSIRIILESFLA